jgi:type II secretory pathway pseudopilin PulG
MITLQRNASLPRVAIADRSGWRRRIVNPQGDITGGSFHATPATRRVRCHAEHESGDFPFVARRRIRRSAFTLMEMILVVAMLVAVVAMALPALRGPMEDQRLLKTADLIRAQWTRARATAMRTGRIHVFRYQVATDIYVVEPWYGDADYLEASSDATAMPAPTGQLSVAPGEDLPNLPLGVSGARLPTGIQFFAGETEVDARSSQMEQQGAMPAAGGDAPPPVVFYPDGSTSDAKVVLTNERFFVEVHIRGLTGMVRVSDLKVAEELTAQGGPVN